METCLHFASRTLNEAWLLVCELDGYLMPADTCSLRMAEVKKEMAARKTEFGELVDEGDSLPART